MAFNRVNAVAENYERTEKSALQRVSLLGSWLLNPYSKKGKPIKPKDLLPFVWEEKAKAAPKPMSAEERAKVFARHDALIKKKFGDG